MALTPSPPLPHAAAVVIVGAGIAASAAAAELCRARPDVRVTMVSREARVKVRGMGERGREEERAHQNLAAGVGGRAACPPVAIPSSRAHTTSTSPGRRQRRPPVQIRGIL